MSHLLNVEEVQYMLSKRYTYQNIFDHYQSLCPGVRGLTKTSVQRFCRYHEINPNCVLNEDEKLEVINSAINKVGTTYGRKMLVGHMQSEGIKMSDKVIAQCLRRVDGESLNERHSAAQGNLNPKIYWADYFGQKLHIDQNEKLGMFGVTHVCARDGFSGMIVGFATMPIKNNVEIYDLIFRNVTTQFGLWDTIRLDGGKEFVLLEYFQTHLQNYRNDTTQPPVRRGKSTDNHVIERIWVEVNKRVNYPIKEILVQLVHENMIDMTDETDKFCASWFACRVASFGVKSFVNAWNNHHIDGKGTPLRLSEKNYCARVPPQILPNPALAAQQYINSGSNKTITLTSAFGIDPVPEINSIQFWEDLSKRLTPFTEVFSALVNKNDQLFRINLLSTVAAGRNVLAR